IDRDGVRGIDERPVRTIVGGALAAVTSDVDEDAYGTDALNERVRDLEWLTPRAAAHQAVNARLLEIADAVVPLAFGALYRDDDRVRDMLRDGGASLSMRVKALTGRAEWVVTVTRAQDRAPEG